MYMEIEIRDKEKKAFFDIYYLRLKIIGDYDYSMVSIDVVNQLHLQ